MKCECGAAPSHTDIGIEVQGVFDGILIWECGSCKKMRSRFDPPDRLHDKALEIIANWEMHNV
jgi:hypothetical protein